MNKISSFVLGIVIGSIVVGAISYKYWNDKLLSLLYFGTVAETEQDLSVLKALENDVDHAAIILKEYLKLNEITLKGCKQDLCKNDTPQNIESTLLKIDEYLKGKSEQ